MDAPFQATYLRASEVYSPSAPIDQRKLFAGRMSQLASLLDAIRNKGQHVVVHGERGVGKTSLVNLLGVIATGASMPIRTNCHSADTFGRMWRRAFDYISLPRVRQQLGFGAAGGDIELEPFANETAEQLTPDVVVQKLRAADVKVVFVFDEFDQLADKTISRAFAEVIKALSDYSVQSKIVLVGVGDTVDAVLDAHTSTERAIKQIHMHRMLPLELHEILQKASDELGLTFDPAAADRVVKLSNGLPHYVHLVGLHATRAALLTNNTIIRMSNIDDGIDKAIGDTSQSVVTSYVKACGSPQRESLYKIVLLACALAETNELGYFAPAALRSPLRGLGRPMEIPAFAAHLNKFVKADRGAVLQKTGVERRFRYRFKNPLLQPYVLMRGIADHIATADVIESLLK